MARKSVVDLQSADKLVADALEDFKAVSEIKYELAKEAYDLQNKKTRAVIDRITETLRANATGYITVQLSPPNGQVVPVKLDNKYLGYNLIFLAMEIVKDLAFVGIKVASFVFPPALCSKCGSELGIPEQKRVKR